MKKRNLYNALVILLIFAYSFIYRFIIYKRILNSAQAITGAFFTVLLFITILFYGFERLKLNVVKKNIVFNILLSLGLYFVVSYGLGFVLGFLNNPYNLSLGGIFNNVFFVLVITITIELLRYNVIRANKDKKYMMYLVTMAIIVFDIFYNINNNSFNSPYLIFVFCTTIVLPSIVKNAVLSYLTSELGYIPVLIYSIIFNTYYYVIPFVPDLGNYLNSSFNILLPLIIYVYASRIIYLRDNKVEHNFVSQGFSWVDVPIWILVLSFVYLVSGVGTYRILSIGSGSMHPYINKGDAVIVEKIKNKEDLEVNDVVLYSYDGLNIVHRIIEINEENGKVSYITKGDFNNAADNITLSIDDIKGEVLVRIPYIGYFSVWLNEWLN